MLLLNDICERKNVLAVWNGVVAHRPFTRYIEAGEDVTSGQMAHERSLREKAG